MTETLGRIGGRTGAHGYETLTEQKDEVSKQYTGYEQDAESGLDFAQARYYNSSHGRFTSVDPLTASASIKDPQTFNRYSYVLNSPYKFSDPLGLLPVSRACGQWCQGSGPYVDGSAFRGTDKTPELPKRQQQAEPAPLPPCPGGHMCFGEQAQRDSQTDSPMSPSERFMAENFGGPGAYFSNPNDGDPVDLVLGGSRNSPNSRTDPENHLYPSATDPNAKSAFYVPDGGTYAGSSYYNDSSNRAPVHVVLIYFKQLGEMKNITIAVFHVNNINIKMPRDSTGRRKLGDLGPKAGGGFSYLSGKDEKGKSIYSTGIHAHIEVFAGYHSKLPELPKPHINFNGVVK